MNNNPFHNNRQFHDNLLPADGIAHYHGRVIAQATADLYYQSLLKEIHWAHDKGVMFGKQYITKRKTAWYADTGLSYKYSGITRTPLCWTPGLLELKQRVESECGVSFNACLLNLYHDGNEGMSWHSDDESELVSDGTIASLSLGAERRFSFRHRQTKQPVSVMLEHGSLLVMKGSTQRNWLHSLPKSKAVHSPRINLTFRTIAGE